MTNMHANEDKVAEWPPSLKKVCLVQEGPVTPR
jgi:hypothetical protein